jgi:diguanylate cyclase (GGDEF)-like protein/PAS domain S-box-containing protein
MLQRVPKFLRVWRRRSVRDAVAIVGLCFVTYIAAAAFDIFGHTYEIIKRYEAYELDEVIVVAFVFGFLMVIYALRRVQELKLEIRKRRQAEGKTSDQALLLTTAINNMSQGLLMFDSDERLVVCNERYRQMYNLSPEMAKPGATLLQLIKYRVKCGSFKGDPNEYYSQLVNEIAMGQATGKSIETPDGRTIHIVIRPMPCGGWVTTHEDITDKMRVKELIEEQALQLDAALENMSQGLCMFDANQRLIVCNKRYADLYGLNEEQTRPGTTLRAILQYRIATGLAPDDHEGYINDRITEVSLNKPYQITNRLRNGHYVSVVHRPMADGGWVATHEDVTDARRREESFRLLFDNNPVAMWVFDRETLRFLAVNDAAVTQYGYSREQFLTMTVPDIRAAQADDSASFLYALPEAQNGELVGQHQRSDGAKIHVAVYSRVLNYENRNARLVAIHDITERKLAEDELRRTKLFLDAVIENAPLPILVKSTKDSRYTLINRATEELFGYKRDEIIGKTPHEAFSKERADGIEVPDRACLLSEQPIFIRDHTVPTPKGARLVTSKKVAIRGDDGKPEYLLTLIDDVTERRQAEQRITHMAHSDSLTDLPNRAAFNECLASTLRLAEAEGRSFALLCVDLDGFKKVNDVYGHTVGDSLLRHVADRLRTIADGAFIARLGGDEFTIIADNKERSSVTTLTDRLLAAFADDFEVDGHRLRQDLSIGVATYPADGTDAEALMNNADAALYRAKTEHPGSVQFFEVKMAARLRERAELQADLKLAIEHSELRLHYQPQLKITGEITGFEALARWQSPKRGMVPPGEFIPIAEESSLILLIGEWVLREACREAVSWKKPLRVAVNVSPIQFRHGDLPRLVHSVLLETGLAPNRLELEITEGVLIGDFSRAVSILRRLKSLGVKIALDDFGTGYSSLSYLHAFPFDKIKIDRTFISDLETNRHSIAIVRALIGLSRSLNIPILAEGVETQAQHAFLAQEGCAEVQGYLTGRPLEIANYAGVVGRKEIATTYSHAV